MVLWRPWNLRTFRAGSWCLFGATSLTLVLLAAAGLAPDNGLTRSYWHPVDASPEPVVDERITSLDLAFIDERNRSSRDYRVRWEGVWYSPRAERVDFYAGADDGVILRVDGETVLERNPAVGMHTTGRTVDLAAGAHQLEIVHWQQGGERSLNLRWAPVGGTIAHLSPTRLFAEDPGPLGYWLRFAAARLPGIVALVWVTGLAALLGLTVYRRATDLGPGESWRRLRTGLLPASLGPSQLLLFGPWTTHDTNRTEFLVGFWEVAPGLVWLLGPIVGALAVLGLILPARWFPRYVAGLFAVGMLLWMQGNLLLADYGLLDGGGLELAAHAWRTPFEAGLWVGVVILAVVFAGAATRIAPVASGLLVALQAIVLLVPMNREATVTGITGDHARSAEATWQWPPPEIYALSSTHNLIHIVLDALPSRAFVDILEADHPAFERDWSGFTLFANHLGAYRHTSTSMPAMLSGVFFRNERPFPEFLARHPSVFNVLGQHGYRLRLLNSHSRLHVNRAFPGVDAAIRYDIPTPYGSYRNYVDAAAAQLLDLSLFRHAPHAFKPSIYRDQRWFFQRQANSGGEADEAFGDVVFLREFTNRIVRGDAAPVYTFVHLLTPHPPIVTDADCRYAPKHRPHGGDFRNQARCALSGVRALLSRLREFDLYDRSAIVVTSDTGNDLSLIPTQGGRALYGRHTPAGELASIVPYATPLLLVKPFAAEGPLQISHAPTSIVDVPATLLDLADLPGTLGSGTSVLRIDPVVSRQRTYMHSNRQYKANPYYDALDVFSVNGHVTDGDAWDYQREIRRPPNH